MAKLRRLLNFSPTPFPEDVEKRFRVVQVPFHPPPDILEDANGTKLANYCEDVILHAIQDKEVLASLKYGLFITVPPALPQAAVILTAILHGLCGHFPQLLWHVKQGDKHVPLAAPVDVQWYREQAFTWRKPKEA